MAFLAHYNLFPDLVFGVQSSPFVRTVGFRKDLLFSMIAPSTSENSRRL